jgi:hypothetical protein
MRKIVLGVKIKKVGKKITGDIFFKKAGNSKKKY